MKTETEELYDVYIFQVKSKDEVFVTGSIMKICNYEAHVAAKVMIESELNGRGLAWTGPKEQAISIRDKFISVGIESQICPV